VADQAHQDALFREVDEDLRHEQFAKLWKAYGGYVVAAALAIVLGVAGYQLWRNYDIRTREEKGAAYARAMAAVEAGRLDEAAKGFADLAARGGGYGVLARLQEAALKDKRGDRAGAVALYRALAEDGSADRVLRDLATLRAALVEMDDSDPAAIARRVGELAVDGNPWRASAREILAALAFKAGDREKARALYAQVADDPEAPDGLRARAAEMLAAIGR
jgi:hypothetical protein